MLEERIGMLKQIKMALSTTKTAPGPGRPVGSTKAEKAQPDGPELFAEDWIAVEIHDRFFEAFQYLLDNKKIQSVYAFCKDHDINKGNFYKLEKDRAKSRIPAKYLHYLVDEYGVSGTWLLVGKGNMFDETSSGIRDSLRSE